MFSSKPKDTALPQPAPQGRAPRPNSRQAPSILSSDAAITGSLVSTGDMQIDGRVEGDVRSVGLVIGEQAEIHGEVLAEDVTVRGRVIGRIRARKILLCATAHVEGDILHEAFAVESGAFFEGNCRHSDNPLGTPAAEAQAKPAQAAAPAAPRAPQQATFAPLGQTG